MNMLRTAAVTCLPPTSTTTTVIASDRGERSNPGLLPVALDRVVGLSPSRDDGCVGAAGRRGQPVSSSPIRHREAGLTARNGGLRAEEAEVPGRHDELQLSAIARARRSSHQPACCGQR